jgi:hypothetical protein
VTLDDARAALTSPDASPEERVGAALALKAAGEPPAELRVAAEAFVEERLRVAVEAVADGDDARAEAALQRLSARR